MPATGSCTLHSLGAPRCSTCERGAFIQPGLAEIYGLLCTATRSILRGTGAAAAASAGAVSLGTLRRLFLEYVGIDPEELMQNAREAHASSDRLAPAPLLALAVPYVPPLDVDSVLELLRTRLAPEVERVSGSAYQRTFAECGSAGVLEVRDGRGSWLDVRVQADRWTGIVHVVERVRRLFNVDVNAQEADLWLHSDPIVGRLVQMRPGVRPPGSWGLFEAAVKAVLGCGWDVRGEDWLGQLVERAGTAMHGSSLSHLTRLFPAPQQLASLPADRLGLPFVKARSVHQLAHVASGGGAVVAASEPMQRRLASLGAIDGVGPVTAARFAWILGDPDAYPEKAGAPLPGTIVTASRKRALHVADRWRPYRSFAYAQLALSDRVPGMSAEGWPAVGRGDGVPTCQAGLSA